MRAGPIFSESMHVAVLKRIRLVQPEDRREAIKRVAIAITIAWVPLAVLVAVFATPAARMAFLIDAAVHARLLLAIPLFIVADYIVLPRLGSMGVHFGTSNLVPPGKRADYEALLASSRRLSAGVWPSGFLLVAVYALVAIISLFVPATLLPSWQLNPQGQSLSIAGYWHLLVSLPMLLGLMLAWLWRLGLWVRFLWRMAAMGPSLIASHPDRAAGLQFLGYSPRFFTTLALAFSVVVAGPLANKVIHGASPLGHETTPIVTAVVMLLLFGSPPLVFSPVLLATWRAGIYHYGDLALRVGAAFEAKWFGKDRTVDDSTLEQPDFSTTTDLYAIAANVYGMRQAIFDIQGLLSVVIASALPFVPIWLSAIPFSAVVDRLVDMLF